MDVLPAENVTVDLLLVPGVTRTGTITLRGEPFGDRIVGFNLAGYPATESGLFVARTGEVGEVALTGIPVGREPVVVGNVEVRWR